MCDCKCNPIPVHLVLTETPIIQTITAKSFTTSPFALKSPTPCPQTQTSPTLRPSTTPSPTLPTKTSPFLSNKSPATPRPQPNTHSRGPAKTAIMHTNNGFAPSQFRAVRTFRQQSLTCSLAPLPRHLLMGLPVVDRNSVMRTRNGPIRSSLATE